VTPGAELWTALGAVLLLLLLWTAWTLARLRRLEGRVARAWTALDTQLQRRAALAVTLARYHPAGAWAGRAAALAAAAGEARAPATGDRELAENALGRELRALPPGLPGVPAELAADLLGTATRVGLARRFYNDAVRDTHLLRRRPLPRLLRSRGRRPLPRFFDIDDGLEEAITRASTRASARSGTPADRGATPAPRPAVAWTGGTRPRGRPPTDRTPP
jgi:hypothetical protein